MAATDRTSMRGTRRCVVQRFGWVEGYGGTTRGLAGSRRAPFAQISRRRPKVSRINRALLLFAVFLTAFLIPASSAAADSVIGAGTTTSILPTYADRMAEPSGVEQPVLNSHLGGEVLYTPHVYAIFMGSNWNKEPGVGIRSQLEHMYEEISGSAWQGILTQYFGAEGLISHSVTHTFFTDASVQYSGPVYDGTVQSEVGKIVTSQGWTLSPSNDQIAVLFAPGTFSGSGSVLDCAEHVTAHIGAVAVSYSTIPYQGDEPFAADCDSYGYGDPVKTTSMAASHEYAESVTDPTHSGWFSNAGGKDGVEIADLCVSAKAQQLPGGAWENEL